MPARTDIHTILLIGSGPIVIGQACEFDYSGTQAAKSLRRAGYRVVLCNSNPATIMTDAETADVTYVEPITPETVAAICEIERPDALLPTLGGQTALNVAVELATSGVLDQQGVELIGASLEAIRKAENRREFAEVMSNAGLRVPENRRASSADEAHEAAAELGFPTMVRPSFVLGGGGTGLASDHDELSIIASRGLAASPMSEIVVEESVLGWKEFELEVMRDRADNAVVVCSIENLDPMGIHTGDSITVAPAQTLSDEEYQAMRNDALACLRAIGVDTGGSNVQFAVDPGSGRRLLIEMNPRVSRSSALASKATGFPIAKIAALLAVGFRLDEISNDITGVTPASFEPALDYVVVKAPRFDFGKFPSASGLLGTAMQSVGEAMAIGRTFPEALQKALRSLEDGRLGLSGVGRGDSWPGLDDQDLSSSVRTATGARIFAIAEALRRGWSPEHIADLSGLDPWFVDQIRVVTDLQKEFEASPRPSPDLLRQAKRQGFSDAQLAVALKTSEDDIRQLRRRYGVVRTYQPVDTCAGEFEAITPYFYGTFETSDEPLPDGPRPRVVICGSGPNRIGQGIEFDYCCVQAAQFLREAGFEVVMVNCNPETVSTDYDISDRLYFEPLTLEDTLDVIGREQPVAVLVQLGGQTPLNLAAKLAERGVPIGGTPPGSIDRAEDRRRFSTLCKELGISQPAHGTAASFGEAEDIADSLGFPLLVRPSFVLGGRAVRVVYSIDELASHVRELESQGLEISPDSPLVLDRFLEAATEADVDAVYDGHELLVGGILEHVQEAGVHSGDSACVIPPPTISEEAQKEMLTVTSLLAEALAVRGLINLQFAVKGDEVFLLEANPRSSRTVPFVSKATGLPLAGLAARVMMGADLAELREEGLLVEPTGHGFVAVKEAVLPWDRFPSEDVVLGPEMRATGEVMGISEDFGAAYAKALLAAGQAMPQKGTAFLSLADRDKGRGLAIAQGLHMAGFELMATEGTARYLRHHGVDCRRVDKVGEGPVDAVQLISEGRIQLVVNTPRGRRARGDGAAIRRGARRHGVPCVTTVDSALALVRSLAAGDAVSSVRSLQAWHA
ncbi:MAG: carbamoyl-phosphate synthase large subunit [Acidimicrobiia bacterium]